MTGKMLLFIGSLNREAPYFQGARGKGLSVYSFNEETLETEKLAETDGVDNPTFLSVSPDGSRIYTNSEVYLWREGLVTAFAFDREASALTHINMQPALGSITAHNSITLDNKHLLVANYAMGEGGPDQSVVAYGIREDGGLAAPLSSVAHSGSGPNKDRQERSHAHSVTPTLNGSMAIVADLGLDALITYRFSEDGALQEIARLQLAPGAGPRHVALHPNGHLVFVMNELDSTVVSLSFDAETGQLAIIDTHPAVPEEGRAENHCADIQISPDGRFIYGSNRGHDSIAIFEVDASSGNLIPRGFTSCGGATPRNLAISPSGRHLFSANQNADRISIFERDFATGHLTDTGREIEIGTPMCIRIISL
ncbi:lactonase family protein [Mesorhizobium sp. SB112]|uniref:lactonase family protein n=1 Tax=Mesorhizobium sp. SB112 TaxID=3151853 RepID=UPI0032654733